MKGINIRIQILNNPNKQIFNKDYQDNQDKSRQKAKF